MFNRGEQSQNSRLVIPESKDTLLTAYTMYQGEGTVAL